MYAYILEPVGLNLKACVWINPNGRGWLLIGTLRSFSKSKAEYPTEEFVSGLASPDPDRDVNGV